VALAATATLLTELIPPIGDDSCSARLTVLAEQLAGR
jgi:hypothetical protein